MSFPLGNSKFSITLKESLFIHSPPDDLYSQILKDNTFPNPKYASNQVHGYSNWETAPTIETFKQLAGGIAVPRGYTQDLLKLCSHAGAEACIEDLRIVQEVAFPALSVELRPYQKRAVEQALKVDQGVIISPTGSGKSLMGLEIIRQRGQKALIIVHRADLAKQWTDVIQGRMGLKAGFIGEGCFEVGAEITIAMVQTLSSREVETRKIGESFGLVLVDEVHHVPAETFSDVVGWMGAKYLYGLSATVGRRDGLEGMIYRSIGNAIATISKAEVETLGATVPVSVQAMKTGFNPGSLNSWNEYLDAIAGSAKRNELIIALAKDAGESVLILCDRIAHAKNLSEMLSRMDIDHVLAHGQLKGDIRAEAMEKIKTANITVGTTGLLGEGLDVSSWGVLIMASPISSEIKLMQAIGRIVRQAPGKEKCVVYDLKDDCGFSGGSFNRRFEIYKKHKIWVNFEN